jgi:glucokinase
VKSVTTVAKNESNPSHIGIEIGGTKLQIVTGDGDAKILQRHRLAVDRAQGGNGIRRQIETTLAKILPQTRLAAVGVGFGGPVDWQTGIICKSHHVEGWTGFELGPWLAKLTHAPVFVDNDANVAALGEAFHGAGKGANPVFYVTLGSGVGGGLVADGRIYHGAKPGEAEIGHVRLDRSGVILESRCSGWSVDARIRALKQTNPSSVLCQLMTGPPGGEARHLTAALKQNDSAAQEILRETAADLAFGLSHVTQLFHPEIVVLGGGLTNIGEPFRAAVERALRPWVMEAFAPGPRISLAALAEEVVPVGALQLAKAGLAKIV